MVKVFLPKMEGCFEKEKISRNISSMVDAVNPNQYKSNCLCR